MNDVREKLKGLLRTLFQFDCADLDFGIYRIMNFKRDAIENFINKGLFDAITKDLDGDRRYLMYRGTVDHREIAVIWRTTEKWEQKDYERDRAFVIEQKMTDDADEVFVNGDSYIPGAKALEPLFKNRMFGGV
jgi:hypothetical protein